MEEEEDRSCGRALTQRFRRLTFVAAKIRQGSSVVEQGTHKPLVGSSNLPPGNS